MSRLDEASRDLDAREADRSRELRKFARRATLVSILRLSGVAGVIALIVVGVRQAAIFVERWTTVQHATLENDRDRAVTGPPAGDTVGTEPPATQDAETPATGPAGESDPSDVHPSPATSPATSQPAPVDTQPAFVLTATVSSPLWSAEYDPRFPIPFASSNERNYLTVTLRVTNPTDTPHLSPTVKLVDAAGDVISGFGPARDASDYQPGRSIPPGDALQGYYTFPVAGARGALTLRLTDGEATRTIAVPADPLVRPADAESP